MGCGCDENTCGTEYTSLPVLEGCPSDTELILVSGATGGVGAGRYALRSWGDLKACVVSVVVPPLIGVVGGGGDDDPIAGAVDFQNDKLIGLGSTNSDRIQIVIDDIMYSNYGTNQNFTFNSSTGVIGGIFWVTGAGLFIDLNQ